MATLPSLALFAAALLFGGPDPTWRVGDGQGVDHSVSRAEVGADSHVFFLAEPSAAASLLAPRLATYDSVYRLAFDPASEPAKADPGLQLVLEQRGALDASDSAAALCLSGGSFMGWFRLAYPKETVSFLPPLLVRAAKEKKPIFAVGGACAFLGGGVVVPRKDLDERQRNPRLADDAPEARVNLDLGPGLMFGSDSWEGSSPARLLQAMHEHSVLRGAYFVGDVLMEFDRSSRTLVVRGPGRLLILDMSRARSFPEGYRGGRLSSLGDGDHWKVGSAPIQMGASKLEGPPTWSTLANGCTLEAVSGRALLEWLSGPRPEHSRQFLARESWSLGWDARSQLEVEVDPAKHRTWLNLPFDCSWRERR